MTYRERVNLALWLHHFGLLPGWLTAWYINRLADRLERQERRVVWAQANVAAWPNRVDRGAPGAAVEEFLSNRWAALTSVMDRPRYLTRDQLVEEIGPEAVRALDAHTDNQRTLETAAESFRNASRPVPRLGGRVFVMNRDGATVATYDL